MPQIEVSFDLDANGILHVTAKDLGTNKEQSIKISSPSKLSKDEVDKFVKQAEQFADEDKKRKEEIEAKNELDSLVYATEKSVKDHGDKVSGDDRLASTARSPKRKTRLRANNVEAMKKAKEALSEASHKLAEAIYKEAAAKGQAGYGAVQTARGRSGSRNEWGSTKPECRGRGRRSCR